MPSLKLALHTLTVLALAVLLNLASSSLKSYLSPSSLVSQNIMSITPVKLYGAPLSTCTRRVATVLKEKNVPYELVPIDLGKGEHKNPQYVAELQPFGQVPVLKDGNFTIYESRAIGRYIALKYASQGTPGLIPPQSDVEAWGIFEQAASIEQNAFDPFASGISFEKVFKLMRGGQTDENRVQELTQALYAKLDVYEVILSKSKYLAGDTVTLADLFHLPYGAMITEKLGIDALTSKPNVARWWLDITSRPSWQAVKDGA